jgi:hypothetical protein
MLLRAQPYSRSTVDEVNSPRRAPRRYRVGKSSASGVGSSKERNVILATTTVEDFDRFLGIFSTKGLEKRREHGSKGAKVFRDPNQDDRVWVIFDWDAEGFQSFVSDPDVPPIMQEAGHKGPPQLAEPGGEFDA